MRPERTLPRVTDLLHNKDIEAKLIHVAMNQVSMSLCLRKGESAIVEMPAGTLLKSGDPGSQDLIVVENVRFTVGPTPRSFQVPTCCTDSRKRVPNNVNYTIVELPEQNELRSFVQRIAASAMPINQRQAAIWQFTNKRRTHVER
jgi:hypothetical protein